MTRREQQSLGLELSQPETLQTIEVQIEELVLHGFPSGDRYDIGSAVERELTRLLTAGNLAVPSRTITAAHVDAGSFTVTQESNAATVGTQIAQAVYGGLKR